jgi:hypothetical protein
MYSDACYDTCPFVIHNTELTQAMTLPEASSNKECPSLQALNGFRVLRPIMSDRSLYLSSEGNNWIRPKIGSILLSGILKQAFYMVEDLCCVPSIALANVHTSWYYLTSDRELFCDVVWSGSYELGMKMGV